MLEVRGLGIFRDLPVAAPRPAPPGRPAGAACRDHPAARSPSAGPPPESPCPSSGWTASPPRPSRALGFALDAALGRRAPAGGRLRMSEEQPTAEPPPLDRPRPVVLVTGLSGAGKASILRVLEDLGFETVDNPPLKVLEELVEDGDGSRSPPASTPAPAASSRPRRWSPWPGCAATPPSCVSLRLCDRRGRGAAAPLHRDPPAPPAGAGWLARQPGDRRHRRGKRRCWPRCRTRPTW